MQLDPVHFVLGGIVMLLVVVVAYLLGTRKTGATNRSKPPFPKDANLKPEFVQVKPAASKTSPTIKKDKKNQKYFSQIEEEWISNTSNFAENCAKLLSVPWYERYNELLETYAAEGVEIGLAEMEKIIHWFDIPDIKSGFETKIDEIAEIVTGIYVESIDEIASVINDKVIDRYKLNNDQKMSEFNKNVNFLRKGFNQVYIAMGEIQSFQSKLQNLWPRYIEIASAGKFDLSSIARNFGAGALAVFNPLIGVPAVIASFSHDAKTEKNENQIMESFSTNYEKYTEKIDQFDVVYTPIFERHMKEIKVRADEYYLPRIIECLSTLDEKGHSLKSVQKTFHESWQG